MEGVGILLPGGDWYTGQEATVELNRQSQGRFCGKQGTPCGDKSESGEVLEIAIDCVGNVQRD